MNLHYSIYMQVEILLGYLTIIMSLCLIRSTQVEILLGYLTIPGRHKPLWRSTQVEILLGCLTCFQLLHTKHYLHK